ncbi:oxidoreductase [Mesobacillus foraminis]|uniref:oxidoreductase n=1 Tax=Mesobacillus foraminis TaxID=279826 RepID=UPI000EF4D582|nr:oxidoreductase [Mesobacillus foraminis]
MTVSIGFIGFGKSTTRYHLPYVLKRKKIRVKTIYSRTRKYQLEQEYQEYGIQFTDDLDNLLKDDEIQSVVICTPHETHYDLARICLEHNKHVIVEKPFAPSVKEARELYRMAHERNLIITPYQNRRFDGDFLALQEVLEKGYIGKAVELESHIDYDRPGIPLPKDHVNRAFYGLGVHTTDQMVSIFGAPEKVYYDIRSQSEGSNDYYHVELFYKNFKAIVKTSMLVKTPYPRFILHGTKGSFIKYGIDKQEECLKAGRMPWEKDFGIDPKENYGKVSFTDEEGKDRNLRIPTPLGDYGRFYDVFVEAVEGKKGSLVTEEEALAVIEILENGFSGQNPRVHAFNKNNKTE